jgi:hypothetical protein
LLPDNFELVALLHLLLQPVQIGRILIPFGEVLHEVVFLFLLLLSEKLFNFVHI